MITPVLEENLRSSLNYRERAAWALLPEHHKTALLKGPKDSFQDGLSLLDHQNRGLDGRQMWLDGLRYARTFTQNPVIIWEWIANCDLYGIDAMVGNMLAYRRGKLDSTRHTDPPTWHVLSELNKIWGKLGFDALDYPAMIAIVKEAEQ